MNHEYEIKNLKNRLDGINETLRALVTRLDTEAGCENRLVSAQECLDICFPNENSRPAIRTFRDWQAHGFIPVHKIGKRTFFDPSEVRLALDRRFKVEAKPLT